MNGIIAKDTSVGGSSESKFTPIPSGTIQAICIWCYDIGTHETQFGTEEPKMKQKVIITFEVQSERIEIDGEDLPRVISHTYNLSLHEKAILCKHLEGFRGKVFTEEEKKERTQRTEAWEKANEEERGPLYTARGIRSAA